MDGVDGTFNGGRFNYMVDLANLHGRSGLLLRASGGAIRAMTSLFLCYW